jgi:hypothetical protein
MNLGDSSFLDFERRRFLRQQRESGEDQNSKRADHYISIAWP